MKIKDFVLSGLYNQFTTLELPGGYSLDEKLTPKRASELLLDICLNPHEKDVQHVALIEHVLSCLLPAGLDLRKLHHVEISSSRIDFIYVDSTKDRSIYYAGKEHKGQRKIIKGDLFREFWQLVNN